MKKISIIGGGASGMACAIMLKRLNPELDITIFEANSRLGKKLSTTGNGRCNISNFNANKNNYHGDRELAHKLLSDFNYEKQKEFFHSIGVPIITEGNGKAYPMSLQANSVVDALRFAINENNIKVIYDCDVSNVYFQDSKFHIKAKDTLEISDVLVIATGGKAGLKNFKDFGYKTLKQFGHKIENTFPSLVQIKTNPETVKQLKGIKIEGEITVSNDFEEKTEKGEILFCDYGISGPPVMQLSRLATNNAIAKIDVLPDWTVQDIIKELEFRTSSFPEREISELFTGLINKRLGQVITKLCKISLNDPVKSLTITDISNLAKTIKCFELKIIGNNGFKNAQVTAGGAQTTQFFDTLMSKKVKGLFAIGEILNVDGDCGGYNLAFCWGCANAAAKGINEFLSIKE